MTVRDVIRVLVAAYFIGLGARIFAGPDISLLFAPLGPPLVATILSALVVIALASLIFLDLQRRLAVIGLALLAFSASYVGLMASITQNHLGSFWRDLAITGLLFFALQSRPQTAPARRKRRDQTPAAQQGPAETENAAKPRHPRRVRTEIYRQDFDIVRVR